MPHVACSACGGSGHNIRTCTKSNQNRSMSRSTTGTRKTSNLINHGSAKKVDRDNSGMRKRGSSKAGTDAAHIFGFGLMNAIVTHTPGRPMSEKNMSKLRSDMNNDSNLRIKSSHGNKVLDERRGARIAASYVNDEPLQGKTTAARAYQAYKSASQLPPMKSLAAALGDMQVVGSSGRTHMLKNHEQF